jgi:D-glycero-D-manno-heptose 1,7-bisphosphate phosphatase
VAMSAGPAAVFVDKDGTLVENVPYNTDPRHVRIMPGVLEGLRVLRDAGFGLFVVSNQPGVALGRFPRAALTVVEARIDELLAAAGVSLDGYAWCPHHPHGTVEAYASTCTCRKPKPGLLLGLATRHGLALGRSWMIGDILDDVEAGHRAGCRAALVDVGGETEWQRGPGREPDLLVDRFDDAARAIVAAHADAAAVAPSSTLPA